MKRIIICFIFTYLFFLLSGCASIQLKNRVADLEAKNKMLLETGKVQKENVDRLDTSISSLKKGQADLSAENKAMKVKIKELQDATEKQQKEINALMARLLQKDEEIKANRERFDRLGLKIGFLESYLGLGEKDSGDKAKWGGGVEKESPKALSDKYQLYSLAYDLFKDGAYDKARVEFQNFLKSFAATEYSDNAQFWIGECHYFEGNYEQAIVEFDKVQKNYPNGDRVAPALLKKGLAYIAIGDKLNGKHVLQQVMKDYPKTYQARQAREKLLELK